MLTVDTKRHIDAARQVLVGKVPNPISQVQEITNALVFKFMDDMDEQAAALGGKRRYFTSEYEKYAWHNIMNPKVGAHEKVALYQEALNRMSTNPNLPKLFQDIFRNAYLPFNDGHTLALFLHEIDYFDYKHSEELGNAYEYLLSIMGSQGDAGQFRTPRHIIDFIVGVVDPGKDDSVLDPACGTAGFLISAYKHVLAKHDGKDDITGEHSNKEIPLTADEKKKLYSNYTGFDIDPSMVKVSQVNMYLHGFPEPKILIHDTLSSEDFWQERYDIIMANPPFMTPKGGIIPHNKFGIQSNRAELLFVDYIKSHLKPSGRAGVIVPEGIIFQSGNAYKQLRKSLVEDGLYAVVSLPAGVFQPYSGVKTSILFFDNELAKQGSELLFVKVQNDGFDLGAQRREHSKNDLPQALEILNKWKLGERVDSQLANYVEKAKITETGDYNLSGDRYRVATDYTNAKWQMVELGEICEFIGKGGRPASFAIDNGKIPFVVSSLEQKKCDSADFEMEALVIGDGGSANIHYLDGKFSASDHTYVLKAQNQTNVVLKYIYQVIRNNLDLIERGFQGQGLKNVSKKHLQSIKIPLPPLEIQEQIVAELDGCQKIIDGAKQITQNWKPKIDTSHEWEMKTVSEVAELEYGIGESAKDSGEYRYIRITDIGDNGELKNTDKKYIAKTAKSTKYLLKIGDVLVARTGATFGKTLYFDSVEKSAFAGFLMRFNFDENKVNSKYFWCFAQSDNYWNQARSLMTGGGQPQFNASAVSKILVPLPSIEIQKQIVEKIEAERQIVEANKKLLEIYTQKTKDTISRLWEK